MKLLHCYTDNTEGRWNFTSAVASLTPGWLKYISNHCFDTATWTVQLLGGYLNLNHFKIIFVKRSTELCKWLNNVQNSLPNQSQKQSGMVTPFFIKSSLQYCMFRTHKNLHRYGNQWNFKVSEMTWTQWKVYYGWSSGYNSFIFMTTHDGTIFLTSLR